MTELQTYFLHPEHAGSKSSTLQCVTTTHCDFILQNNNVIVQVYTFSAQHRTAVYNGTYYITQGLLYILALGKTTKELLYIMALGTQHRTAVYNGTWNTRTGVHNGT
jgi:hypothetical protein